MQNIKKICSRIPDDSYRRIIITYVAFVLGKRVDNAGFGVVWAAGRTSPVHVLTMRRPSISYNFAESNPFAKVSGGIVNIIQSVSKSIKFAQQQLSNTATCKNESVTRTSDKQYDIIITDPPYGDDVQYGELSEFFYVWMRRVLNYDDLPSRIPLDEDYCESQGRFGDREKARAFFGYGLERSFSMINRKLKDDGLLVVLFAHSTTSAWNQFFTALQKAKLSVVSSYAVHTELSTNVLARGKSSFMSSIMVTCRKITVDSVRYYEDLIPEIDDGISKILDDIGDEQLLDLSITDLIIMVYGNVLEKSTQHTTLKSYEKDRRPDFETLLANARSTIIKQLVEKLLKKQSDIVGPQMSFYVINKIFNNGAISSDDALKIVQTYNTTLPALSTDGVITQKKDVVHLEGLKRIMDYAPDKIDPANLHQQLCYLASHPQNVAQLLHHDNIKTDLLKDVVEILIKNYRNKKQKGQSTDDKEEVRILENIADHMGISTSSSYNYSGRDVKKTHQRDRKSMRDEAQSHLEQWK